MCVCVFRVTRVLLEVLVFQVWTDVTEPKETEANQDILENTVAMENWSDIKINEELTVQRRVPTAGNFHRNLWRNLWRNSAVPLWFSFSSAVALL